MPAPSRERVRDEVGRLAHRGGDISEFARGVSRILGRAVAFDGICLLTLDPATFLPTESFGAPAAW